jgi:hypothetical protein
MPENITPIEFTYELPYGVMTMTQVSDLAEATYYAKGKRAYLYASKIINAMYLFVPVLEK